MLLASSGSFGVPRENEVLVVPKARMGMEEGGDMFMGPVG